MEIWKSLKMDEKRKREKLLLIAVNITLRKKYYIFTLCCKIYRLKVVNMAHPDVHVDQ